MENLLEVKKRTDYRSLALVVLTFVVANILMLFINGVWWDDWAIWNAPEELFEHTWGGNGFNIPILAGYYQFVLSHFSLSAQIYVFHCVSFLCGLVSVICIYFTLKKILRGNAALFIALLVASNGINRCLILVACSNYTISNAFFWLGTLLFVSDYFKKRNLYKVLNAFCWLFSLFFWRSTILVIPFVVAVAVWVRYGYEFNKCRLLFGWVMKSIRDYWYIVLVCLLYVILYLLYLKPQGWAADYYTVHLGSVIMSPITSVILFFRLLVGYLGILFSMVIGESLVFTCGITLLTVAYYWIMRRNTDDLSIVNKKLLLVFLLFFVFSMAPPMFVEKLRMGMDCFSIDSRIASLSALPVSFFLFYLSSLLKVSAQRYFVSLLIACSVVYTASSYFDYMVGWEKEKAIVKYLIQTPHLNGTRIQVEDYTLDLNEYGGMEMPNYAYEGCSRLAYGKDTKTVMRTKYYLSVRTEPFEPQYILRISPNVSSRFSKSRFLFYYFLNKDKSEEMMMDALYLNIESME